MPEEPDNLKVRVIVRRDLSPQQQVIQTTHAVVELLRIDDWNLFGQLVLWAAHHKTLVVFGVETELELMIWESLLHAKGVAYRPFYESDMNNQMTAIAVHPDVDQTIFDGLELL